MPLDSVGVIPPRPVSLARHAAGAALLALWLGGTAWAFWRVEVAPLRPFATGPEAMERLARFPHRQLDPAAVDGLLAAGGPTRAVVVHLRDPACPCTAAADAHFEALRLRHGGDAVVFAVADAPGSAAQPARGLGRLPRLSADAAARLWDTVPAAPAAAVFDGRGVPLYLGPYADGGWCSAARGGPVDAVLAAARDGQSLPVTGGLATGCFCDRTSTAASSAASPFKLLPIGGS
jgi:hypothetical protein